MGVNVCDGSDVFVGVGVNVFSTVCKNGILVAIGVIGVDVDVGVGVM